MRCVIEKSTSFNISQFESIKWMTNAIWAQLFDFSKKKSLFAAYRLQSALQFLLFNLDTFYRVCDELYYSKFSFFITLTLYCPFASWIAGGQKVSCKIKNLPLNGTPLFRIATVVRRRRACWYYSSIVLLTSLAGIFNWWPGAKLTYSCGR